MSSTNAPCDFCGKRPRSNGLLCIACVAMPSVAALYKPHVAHSPGWAAHLARLAARAKARLPLFSGAELPLDRPTSEPRARPVGRPGLTISEVAELLGTCRASVVRMVKDGRLPAPVRHHRAIVRFDPATIPAALFGRGRAGRYHLATNGGARAREAVLVGEGA